MDGDCREVAVLEAPHRLVQILGIIGPALVEARKASSSNSLRLRGLALRPAPGALPSKSSEIGPEGEARAGGARVVLARVAFDARSCAFALAARTLGEKGFETKSSGPESES